METKRLNCKLTDVKVADLSDQFYTFEGYASTFGNVDRGDDAVVKGAFKDCLKELNKNATPIPNTEYSKLLPVLWQHEWDEPIGSFVEMKEDDKGLYVKAIMPKDDDFVKGRVIPQMKAGSVSDMSIGFMINDYSINDGVRMLEKLNLYETSLVTIPMNPEANLTTFKSAVFSNDLPMADKSTPFDHDAAQDRHSEKGVDHQSYLIADNKGDVVEYLLPVTDFVDGKLMVIPKAVFYAAYKINKINIDDATKENVIANIEKYYQKMGLESPYMKSGALRIDDAEVFSERELESLMKSGVSFSQTTAKAIISVLKSGSHRDDDEAQRDAELKANLEKLLNTL